MPADLPADRGAAASIAAAFLEPTRLDRRKARTRQALLDAARGIIVELGTTDASIQEITERADVGFGSFYNHFGSKSELFEAVVTEVLEEHAQLMDEVTAGIVDPAEVFAVRVRVTADLADTRPAMAHVLVHAGLGCPISPDGPVPRVLRDLERAVESEPFAVSTPFLAVATTTGCLLAYLQVCLRCPNRIGHDSAAELAEEILRMLGVSSPAAHEIAHRPMPAPPEAARSR